MVRRRSQRYAIRAGVLCGALIVSLLWGMSDWHGIIDAAQQLPSDKGAPGSVAYSPDGHWLATASSCGTTMYDAQTLSEQWFVASPCTRPARLLDAHGRAIAFSPDSTTVAVAPDADALHIYASADGSLVRTIAFPSFTYGASVLSFSPDGMLLAAAAYNYQIFLWRVADGMLVRTFGGNTTFISNIVFSRDGSSLTSVAQGARYAITTNTSIRDAIGPGHLYQWRVDDGSVLLSLGLPGCCSQAISPDGTMVALVMGGVQVYSVANGALNPIATIAAQIADGFSLDGTVVLTAFPAGENGEQIWRTADGTLLQTLTDEMVGLGVAISPDDGTVATFLKDGSLQVWHIADGAVIHRVDGYDPQKI